ncbi:hypothetical protein ACFP3U_16770 [Kitasatospora misakiensis]|uniref:Uncharacterized protein n=1 Tax=Kitasatospora misakiensis TaxID=67330 RepID=A0ABW0X682_9ACTN
MTTWGGALTLLEGVLVRWPWWALLIGVLAWVVVYICRQLVLYRLLSKALDKVDAKQVPQVVAVLAGSRRTAGFRLPGRRRP